MAKKFWGLGAVCAAALLAGCAADTTGASTDESSGLPMGWPDLANEATDGPFDGEEIAALEARMAQFVEDEHVVGIETMLVKDGQVVSYMNDGLMRLSSETPVQKDTIWRIYSMTKPVTGVAMMQLYEQGLWTLDDPVTKFIPEFENLRVLDGMAEDGTPQLVDATRPPTMREVMSHSAGFAYGLFGNDPANKAFRDGEIMRSPDMQTFIDKTAEVPLLFQPGTAWFYSAAVDVQGAIIERLSGMTLGEYFQEKIFAPLNMEDTAFFVAEDKMDRFTEVYGYNPRANAWAALPLPQYLFREDTISFESGGGGLTSTITDYARFCQMLVNEGELSGTRIVSAESVQLMQQDALDPSIGVGLGGSLSGNANPLDTGFGLDFGITRKPGMYSEGSPAGIYYWGGAAGTWFWIDPTNDLFFIGMINKFGSKPGTPNYSQVSAELIYSALKD